MDGNWTTDHTAPQENDGHNNFNNVLLPENIHKSSSSVPKSNDMSDVPGSFPETPANEVSEFSVGPGPTTPARGESVNRSSDQKTAGPDVSTPGPKSSTAHGGKSSGEPRDGSQQTFGVSPLPATSGLGNPIQLRPGEKVPDPSTFTRNTINSTVMLDEKSYENAFGAPQLPDVVTPEKEREAKGGMFGLPLMGKNMIPESSLPMGQGTSGERDPGVTVQSASPQSTTATLAANVPRERRGIPEIVQESQTEAGVEPEASANAEAVREKHAVEQELESKIPEKPATTESGDSPAGVEGVPEIVQESRAKAGYPPEASSNPEAVREKRAVEEELEQKVPAEPATVENDRDSGRAAHDSGLSGNETAGLAVGGLAAAGGLAGALSHESSGASADQRAPHGLPPSVLQSIEEMNKGHVAPPTASGFSPEDVNKGSTYTSTAPDLAQAETHEGIAVAPIVPDVVQESIAESHQSPEAAANPVAVEEKNMVEEELLMKVKTEEGLGEPAPSSSPALAETAPTATTARDLMPAPETSSAPLTSSRTEEFTETAPTATTTHGSMPLAATSSALPTSTRGEELAAPASAQAITPTTRAAEQQAVDSRDVSPMSKPPTTTQVQPMVTSGVGQSTTPQTSQGPSSAPATATPPKPATKAAAPSKVIPGSSKTVDSSASGPAPDKKKKRASGFFGKLKEKFSDKDKK